MKQQFRRNHACNLPSQVCISLYALLAAPLWIQHYFHPALWHRVRWFSAPCCCISCILSSSVQQLHYVVVESQRFMDNTYNLVEWRVSTHNQIEPCFSAHSHQSWQTIANMRDCSKRPLLSATHHYANSLLLRSTIFQ